MNRNRAAYAVIYVQKYTYTSKTKKNHAFLKFCIWVTKLQQQGADTNMAIIFTFCSSYLTAFKHQTSKPHPDQALARSSPCYFTKKKIASLLHSDVQKKYLTT